MSDQAMGREEVLYHICMLCSIDNEHRDKPHRNAIEACDAALREELEQVRVQLAGCLSAAEGATSDPAKPGDYGWSVAYQAVIKLREELAQVKAERDTWKNQFDLLTKHAKLRVGELQTRIAESEDKL